MRFGWFIVGSLCAALGCRSTGVQAPLAKRPGAAAHVQAAATADATGPIVQPASYDETSQDDGPNLVPADASDADVDANETNKVTAETIDKPSRAIDERPDGTPTSDASTQGLLNLPEVVQSVRMHYPLVRLAFANRTIASGETLSAAGAFDHKLDAFSESQPLDFYENYRHSVGLKRDTYWGGQVFAGYRVGRGEFEPWYLERETNKGGEFKAGFVAPLIGDKWIDQNRAELWRAQLEQRRVEPEIQAQIIEFVRQASAAYFSWVAAGANFQVAEDLLRLAERRNDWLEEQVAAEQMRPIDQTDNRRIIVLREAKTIDARRKLEQAAVKLSLFLRAPDGSPQVPATALLPTSFPPIEPLEVEAASFDRSYALENRPELAELQFVRRQLNVALQQAGNETLPDVDAGIKVAQDVGEPTSSKRDKSEFELEAMLTLEVPLERRKALGKIRSLRGKLAQVQAKTQFQGDKIVAEVQLARAALEAAAERVERIDESYRLAVTMQQAERDLFEEGQSTLFNLNLREQQTAETAAELVNAKQEYFIARANYLAALGLDDVP